MECNQCEPCGEVFMGVLQHLAEAGGRLQEEASEVARPSGEIRVVATRGWTIVSTRHTAIRIRSDGVSFVLDVLPWLTQSDDGSAIPGWVSELRCRLENAGISALARRSQTAPDRELATAAARETALVGMVREELSRVGVKLAASAPADFVLADMSDIFDQRAAVELTR